MVKVAEEVGLGSKLLLRAGRGVGSGGCVPERSEH
jgi:hypothetical protein